MKKFLLVFSLLCYLQSNAQVKLHLDSQLLKAYEKKYRFNEGLMCVPFYCDPFFEAKYKKGDTNGLCGKYVFVNTKYELKIRPVFDLPCWFEPRFGEGLCAVSINQYLTFIDTLGKVVFKTDLQACNSQKNKISPFRNGRAKVYKGGNTMKHYYEVYYLDKNGKRIREGVNVRVKPKGVIMTPPVLVVVPKRPMPAPDLPKMFLRGKYPVDEITAKRLLSAKPHSDNRLLLYFDCGQYQLENMDIRDTMHCGKFLFTDTFFNIKIAGGFKLPCAFEPEFSEGLCAVSIDSMLVYIDTAGVIKIHTGLKSCSNEYNKASTFKNGIATLYQGDPYVKGLYKTFAINTNGERVRLLEYDDLELAELKVDMFTNLTAEEAKNCFVGRGKTNGIWFLIEKSGKVRKKLELKR